MVLSLSSGLFEVRVQEYLDSIHENEHRRVNKFLKGLGKVFSELLLCYSETSSVQTIYWRLILTLSFFSFAPGNKMKFLSKK